MDEQALAAHANAVDRKFAVLFEGSPRSDLPAVGAAR